MSVIVLSIIRKMRALLLYITTVAQWLRCCATNRKVAGSIPSDIKSFRSHYGPGVDSASNRNEYQEHFLGGKGGRCIRLTTLPPSCAIVMKSGNLSFLEPSGPLQACNGTALPLLLYIDYLCIDKCSNTNIFSSALFHLSNASFYKICRLT